MSDMPWLPYYGEMPATIKYPDKTLYQMLNDSVRAHPLHPALSFLGETIRYRSLKREVDAVARGLRAIGAGPGDRICALLTNSPHAVVLLYAANRIGAVVSYFHPDSGAREIEYLIDDLEPSFAVVTEEHLAGLQRLLRHGHIRAVVTTSYSDHASRSALRRYRRWRLGHGVSRSGIRAVTASPHDDPRSGDAYETPPTFSWQSIRSLAVGEAGDPQPREPGRPATIVYTGGTSGTPVGVVLSDSQLNAEALQMQVQGPILAGQTILSVAPVSHGYGLGVAVHSALACGALTVLLPHYTSRSLAGTIRRVRPEYLVGVPKMYSILNEERRFRRIRLSFLMGAFCGSDRLSGQVRNRFDEIVRRRGGAVRIREGYGMTETVAACAVMPEDADRPGSVGIPCPDMRIRIALQRTDDTSGGGLAWLAPGELGEICVSGPTVMTGYWRRPEEDARVLERDDQGRVWLRSGDVGRIDADGFLYFIQRCRRTCSIDGESVMPGVTEIVLCEHEAVREAIVVGTGGEGETALVAHVVAVDNDLDVDYLENELRLVCAQQLGRALQPERYQFHERLPLTPTGVVDYRRVGA